ncbi:hypothetical protein FOL46_008238 [Perkinsus olseni]|nr:hypothetical protein FOL46_008238 [Perkinsus olseni]
MISDIDSAQVCNYIDNGFKPAAVVQETSRHGHATTPACAESGNLEYRQHPCSDLDKSIITSPQSRSSDPDSRPKQGRRRRQHLAHKGAYKTELCRCVVEGTHCRFGAQRCKWAHSLQELIDRRNMSLEFGMADDLPSLMRGKATAVDKDNKVPVRRYSLEEPSDMRNLLPISIWAELLVSSYVAATPSTSSSPNRTGYR